MSDHEDHTDPDELDLTPDEQRAAYRHLMLGHDVVELAEGEVQ